MSFIAHVFALFCLSFFSSMLMCISQVCRNQAECSCKGLCNTSDIGIGIKYFCSDHSQQCQCQKTPYLKPSISRPAICQFQVPVPNARVSALASAIATVPPAVHAQIAASAPSFAASASSLAPVAAASMPSPYSHSDINHDWATRTNNNLELASIVISQSTALSALQPVLGEMKLNVGSLKALYQSDATFVQCLTKELVERGSATIFPANTPGMGGPFNLSSYAPVSFGVFPVRVPLLAKRTVLVSLEKYERPTMVEIASAYVFDETNTSGSLKRTFTIEGKARKADLVNLDAFNENEGINRIGVDTTKDLLCDSQYVNVKFRISGSDDGSFGSMISFNPIPVETMAYGGSDRVAVLDSHGITTLRNNGFGQNMCYWVSLVDGLSAMGSGSQLSDTQRRKFASSLRECVLQLWMSPAIVTSIVTAFAGLDLMSLTQVVKDGLNVRLTQLANGIVTTKKFTFSNASCSDLEAPWATVVQNICVRLLDYTENSGSLPDLCTFATVKQLFKKVANDFTSGTQASFLARSWAEKILASAKIANFPCLELGYEGVSISVLNPMGFDSTLPFAFVVRMPGHYELVSQLKASAVKIMHFQAAQAIQLVGVLQRDKLTKWRLRNLQCTSQSCPEWKTFLAHEDVPKSWKCDLHCPTAVLSKKVSTSSGVALSAPRVPVPAVSATGHDVVMDVEEDIDTAVETGACMDADCEVQELPSPVQLTTLTNPKLFGLAKLVPRTKFALQDIPNRLVTSVGVSKIALSVERNGYDNSPVRAL